MSGTMAFAMQLTVCFIPSDRRFKVGANFLGCLTVLVVLIAAMMADASMVATLLINPHNSL